MDRDPSTTGAMRGSGLCRAHVLTTLSVAPGQATRLASEQRTLHAGEWVTTVRRSSDAVPGSAPERAGHGCEQRTLPTPEAVAATGAKPETRKPGVAAGGQVGTPQSGVFPGRAIPGMLDGRGVSGDGQRTPPGPAMPTLMVLAVRLVRVMAGMARGRAERARAEVAG